MDDSPLTLGVLERGEFTKKFNNLKVGDELITKNPLFTFSDRLKEGSQALIVND